jgi:hypothetical protein
MKFVGPNEAVLALCSRLTLHGTRARALAYERAPRRFLAT